MAVPPRPISPRIQYSGSSAVIAGCQTGVGAASASGPGSLCVESQHHFAQLDAVAIGQLTLSVEVRQLLVVHYYRVGPGKIRDHPLSARVRKPCVLATHRTRVQGDVLRRRSGIPPQDQMRLLASYPNEADLLLPGVAG